MGWAALALALVIALSWLLAPSTSDIQARVDAAAARHHDPVLAPGEVPPVLAQAVVATEDERFYQHHGIDVIGLARSLWFDVSHRCACQGGSTITAQLGKDMYLGGSDRGLKKLEELVLAVKIETTISKQRILADYLSEIPTGPGLYGVTAASCAYYRRPLEGLTLPDYALLAGLTQAPSAYDPLVDPSLARERRAAVLAAMVSEDYITPAAAAAAARAPIVPPGGPGCQG
ncbi:MAG: transglycosylase domain-containing protein [Candidatus Dormibacterales bacterium]